MPGIKGYVQKPFSLDALMQCIVQAVDGEAS
jgi:DNA-binding NarL/FixJ family response regulator